MVVEESEPPDIPRPLGNTTTTKPPNITQDIEDIHIEESPDINISDYVTGLSKGDKPDDSDNNELLQQIQDYVEDLLLRYKTQISAAMASGGGVGLKDLPRDYSAGGTMTGDLNITGQILSGGTNINTLFGSGSLTKADADTYYVNVSGDTMTGALSTTSLHTTGQILSSGIDIHTLFGTSGGGGTSLTVKDSDGTPSISAVDTIEFDGSTGLAVTSAGPGTAKIALGSHWKDIEVTGQDTLTPTGEESLQIEAGSNIILTTDTGAAPQTLVIATSSNLTKANADTYYVNLSGDTMTGALSTTALSAGSVHTTGQMLSGGVDIQTLFGSDLVISLSGNKVGNDVSTSLLTLSAKDNIGLISNTDTNTITLSGPVNTSQLVNDSGFMTGLVVATEAEIFDPDQWLSINLVPGALALASDSGFFFSRIENTINQHAHQFNAINTTGTDIGIDSRATTKHDTMGVNIIGLGNDYISDKYIFNCTIGDSDVAVDGSIKYDNTKNALYVYKNGAFRQILDSIRINVDERDQLEYLPEGRLNYIDIHTGDSDDVDIVGTRLIQEYHTNIGAYQTKVVISGGTF